MMKTLILFLAAGALNGAPFQNYTQKIAVQNSILAKVNGQTISMIDVKKKMDMLFHHNYPQLIDSDQARFQFYEASWRHVLREMIDQELMIADALDREIKITEGDVREEMEDRFGPNVMQTLDQVGLTYDEAWKMLKNEMIVQRMQWWFIQSRALSSVTPQDIKQAYQQYLKENPPYTEWKYQMISIRTEDEAVAERIYRTLTDLAAAPDATMAIFKEPGVSISNELTAKGEDLSDLHKAALEKLDLGTYSEPSFQISRADQKKVYRIFYLADKTDYPAPPFDVMAQNLKSSLVQKAMVQESDAYLIKLRKHYGFDGNQIIPNDLHPFSLQ